MSQSSTLTSLSLAAAVAAALSFGGAVHAQTQSQLPPPSGDTSHATTMTGKTDAQKQAKKAERAEKKARMAAKTPSPSGTNAEASKLGDASKPVQKGDGKS